MVRQNLTAPNAASATRAEPAMLDHGRPCHPDCSAPDHPGEPTSKSRFREPGAAAAVGCLPSHLSEADRSLARPAIGSGAEFRYAKKICCAGDRLAHETFYQTSEEPRFADIPRGRTAMRLENASICQAPPAGCRPDACVEDRVWAGSSTTASARRDRSGLDRAPGNMRPLDRRVSLTVGWVEN